MKKLLSVLLVALMVVSLFANGTSEAPAEPETTTIRYWQHSSAARDAMMERIIAMFEEKYPQYKVEAEFIPEADYNQKLIPALATDTAPDVFQIQQGMVAKLAEACAIQPLDTSVMSPEDIAKNKVSSAVDGLKYDGEYYGMPTDTQTIILMWNKDHAREAGLDAENGPQTWDEFFDWAYKLTKKDAEGNLIQAGWGGKGYWCEVMPFAIQHGGKMNDENGNFIFADDPVTIAAVKEYFEFAKAGNYSEKFTKNWAGFRQGLVSIMLGHPAMIGNLVTTAPNLDYGVALIPAVDGENHLSCVSSWAYVMSSKAPSKAATTFIDFLASEEVEKMWTSETGQLPVTKSLLNDDSLKTNPKIAIAISSIENSVVGTLQTGAMNKIWSNGMSRIMNTDEKVEDVLRDIQNQLNEELHSEL